MSRVRRSQARGVLAVALGLALSGCGSGGTAPEAGGELPSRATTTTARPPAAADSGGDVGGGGTGGGGTGGAGVSSAGATTEVALYFTRGEQVERVTRRVPKVTRIGAEAMKALLAGPDAAERADGLATAIPPNTQFRDLVIQDGQARVDLSSAFESGGGGLGLTLRLAQVTCTLDAFPTVSGVRFALDGETVDVLSGDGVVVDRPVSCDSYREYLSDPPPAVRVVAFDGIWPFVTPEEAATYAAGSGTTFLDPTSTARAFAQEYLEMADPVTFPFRGTGPGQGEVPVGFGTGEGGVPVADPQPTTMVSLVQIDAGERSPWTVTGAAAPEIVVDSPTPWSAVGSPLTVSGRARAFEGTVQVRVREHGMAEGDSLGGGFVTGGGDALRPFSGEISFRAPSRSSGAVLFYEASAADGSVLGATVVPVRF